MKRKYLPSLRRRIAASALIATCALPVMAQKPEPVPLRRQATPSVPVAPPLTESAAPDTTPPPVAAPTPPPAATTPTPRVQTPNQMVLNFQAADLQAVVKAISQMTGRNFLLDPRLKGQITIISAKPVTSAAAYQIFVSALKAQGFAAVEGPGNLVKIIPTGEARHHAPVSANEPGGGEQIVTHVVVLQHASAAQMVPLLRPLMAPTSQLVAYDASNALIITDYADNVRRMLRIIDRIDQPVSNDVNVITLQHASALDIAEMIARLSLPGISPIGAQPGAPPIPGGGADRFSIVPDMRTNSLLVRADNPGRVNQLRSLIGKLDVPATTDGSTRVIYIRNANAVKLAEVLRGLLAGEARAAQPAVAPGRFPQRAVPTPTGTSTEQASLIQADEATNALIINASDAVYNNLRAVIEKLDVRRAQVYVEALIVEMTQDNALQLGIQWAAAKGVGSGDVAGIQNFPSARPGIVAGSLDPTTFASSGGFTLAYLGKEIRLADGRVIRNLGGLARALEEGSLANILSTPNLITLDNAEAKIIVGQNVPFVTGSFAQASGASGTGAAVNPFQTIERKDVGLTLKIKPQISEGGSIKLDLFQEVSNISQTSVSGASDLITNKRSIETKVAIDDGDTIVLGGLIEDTQNETMQAVPILGSIPLLGALFRYRATSTRKTNLMIFLRPLVIRTPDDGYRLTADRYEYLRAQTKTTPQQEALDRISPRRPVPQKEGLLGPNVPDEFAK